LGWFGHPMSKLSKYFLMSFGPWRWFCHPQGKPSNFLFIFFFYGFWPLEINRPLAIGKTHHFYFFLPWGGQTTPRPAKEMSQPPLFFFHFFLFNFFFNSFLKF
jgi:hypothetical protein